MSAPADTPDRNGAAGADDASGPSGPNSAGGSSGPNRAGGSSGPNRADGTRAPAGAAAAESGLSDSSGSPEPAAVPEGEDRRGLQAGLALGVLMLVAAVVTLVDAAGLEGGAQAALLGAGAFPTVISVLLILIGAALAVRSLLALRVAPALAAAAAEAAPALRGRLIRLAALVAVLVVFAGVLPYAGFTLSAGLLFTAAAMLLGAPHPWRMAAYGWTLAGLLFLLFDVLIGLSLPAGPWGF